MVARGGLKGLPLRRCTSRRRLPTAARYRQTSGPAAGVEAGPGDGTVGDPSEAAASRPPPPDAEIIGFAPKETQSIIFRCLLILASSGIFPSLLLLLKSRCKRFLKVVQFLFSALL